MSLEMEHGPTYEIRSNNYFISFHYFKTKMINTNQDTNDYFLSETLETIK